MLWGTYYQERHFLFIQQISHFNSMIFDKIYCRITFLTNEDAKNRGWTIRTMNWVFAALELNWNPLDMSKNFPRLIGPRSRKQIEPIATYLAQIRSMNSNILMEEICTPVWRTMKPTTSSQSGSRTTSSSTGMNFSCAIGLVQWVKSGEILDSFWADRFYSFTTRSSLGSAG